jgi:hypothetical protein
MGNSWLSSHAFQSLLICKNPINDEEVMIAGTPGTCRTISETATLATSFYNPKQWSTRLHPLTKDPKSHP